MFGNSTSPIFLLKKTRKLLCLIFFFISLASFSQVNSSFITKDKNGKFGDLRYGDRDSGILVFRFPLIKPMVVVHEVEFSTDMHLGSFKINKKICRSYPLKYISDEKKGDSTVITIDHKQFSGKIIIHPTMGNIKEFEVSALISVKPPAKSLRVFRQYSCDFIFMQEPDEIFWGGGEQFSHCVLNGLKVPFWVEEQGVGRGDQPVTFFANMKHAGGHSFSTYTHIPYIVSSAKRSFFCKSDHYIEYDFRRKSTVTMSSFDGLSFRYIFSVGIQLPTPEKNNKLPDWVFGTIAGLQGGTDTVLKKLEVLERNGAKISAVWIQDWCGRRITPLGKQLKWNWQLDTVSYQDFERFKNILKEKNIALLGYVNPFLAADLPLAATALEKGYVMTHYDKTPYKIKTPGFEVYIVDIYNEEARKWLSGIIRDNLIGNGFDGWMADFGEWTPVDTKWGISGHNRYPHEWAQLNSEVIENSINKARMAFFSRAKSGLSTLKYQFYWAGDQNTSWQKNDGLPSLVKGLLSGGVSGMAVNHGDVGGFFSAKKGPFKVLRSREMLKRWIELCAFTGVFRTHECILPQHNIQVYEDNEMASFFAKFSTIREKIKPYLHALGREATGKNLPMVRPLWLHYPDDRATWKLENQFLLGKDILVIPVVKRNTQKVKGYFPNGEWIHFFTKESLISKGEWKRVSAPVGTPAVYIRAGSKAAVSLH